MAEITYADVLKFISDRVANAEDFEDWESETDSYCKMLYDDVIAYPQR
jgi:hypothetical protein